MNILVQDQFIMDLAKRSAISFCRNHRPWGMDADDVHQTIRVQFWKDEIDITIHPKDSPERLAAAKRSIGIALNKMRDASKHERSCLQPFQVRKAYERGENIDKAMNRLGNDMEAWYKRGNSDKLKHRYLKIAFRHMLPKDVEICRAYMKLGSWEKVAAEFGYSEGDFRRNVMPGLKERAQAVWKKVW